ncbi:MAG: leucine-rich repeat domain-containing protein [Oscillospiraceae bacterium]|jgi:hypothetical protein|nr:leucine-rich repeat domain-containing protein [Oscillospiraceae bacterium]
MRKLEPNYYTYISTNSDFTYNVSENGTAKITGYTEIDTEVEIPAEINGYVISAIGNNTFFNCISLTSITIPDSVTSIGTSEFTLYQDLISVIVPDTITLINDSTFSGCSSLTSKKNKFLLN